MKFYGWICLLIGALVVMMTAAPSAVCFGQAMQHDGQHEKEIYSVSADAHAEIKEALRKAAADNKRVIVVFGANWCFDCHALDKDFHRPEAAAILDANYEVVHVDTGRGEKNQDLMAKYLVPIKRGIPGLAVLDSDGKLIYSQKNGEFENARSLTPEAVVAFLNQWKPRQRS
jgi:thioredoxin 1